MGKDLTSGSQWAGD